MKLSILIPTLNEPESIRYLRRLRGILDPQVAKYPGEVEIRINDAGRAMPTGTKRNQLIANSDGEYFSMIDCDDTVADFYVDELMKGIAMGVDVISFRGYMTTDGGNRRNFIIKKDNGYYEEKGVYYRYCNHLCCFRRAVVERVKFLPIWVQEDYNYATEIKRKNLLKTEYFVDRDMYAYEFRSKKQSYASSPRLRR